MRRSEEEEEEEGFSMAIKGLKSNMSTSVLLSVSRLKEKV